MPIYEYRCKECHQLFEEWCRHIEDENVCHFCPICKGEASRLVSNTSFALKGGGWYVTEYGSRKNAPGNGASVTGGAPGNGGDPIDGGASSGGPAPTGPASAGASTSGGQESAAVEADSLSFPAAVH